MLFKLGFFPLFLSFAVKDAWKNGWLVIFGFSAGVIVGFGMEAIFEFGVGVFFGFGMGVFFGFYAVLRLNF